MWKLAGDSSLPYHVLKIDGRITSVRFSPDSCYIAAGTLDGCVYLWHAETGALIHKIGRHTDSIYYVSFSSDGREIISSSLDKTVKIWDVSSREPGCKKTLKGHEVHYIPLHPKFID